jgi:hypothetical protein
MAFAIVRPFKGLSSAADVPGQAVLGAPGREEKRDIVDRGRRAGGFQPGRALFHSA